MSIKINTNLCIGCGKCSNVCPGNLLKIGEESKAYIKHPKDCWGCTSCIKECPQNAIDFYLGADIGGDGTTVNVDINGDISSWIFNKPNNEKIIINVNKNNSNSY